MHIQRETWGAELYGDPCRECGYAWSLTPADAVALVRDMPARFQELLEDADGTARHHDLEWTAGAYVCHVTDNLRIWAERLAGATLAGHDEVPGYDEKLLARARNYADVSVTGALWSLTRAARDWVEAVQLATAAGVVLNHALRGEQRVADVARNNAHDAHHHAWDIERTLSEPTAATDR